MASLSVAQPQEAVVVVGSGVVEEESDEWATNVYSVFHQTKYHGIKHLLSAG